MSEKVKIVGIYHQLIDGEWYAEIRVNEQIELYTRCLTRWGVVRWLNKRGKKLRKVYDNGNTSQHIHF